MGEGTQGQDASEGGAECILGLTLFRLVDLVILAFVPGITFLPNLLR